LLSVTQLYKPQPISSVQFIVEKDLLCLVLGL